MSVRLRIDSAGVMELKKKGVASLQASRAKNCCRVSTLQLPTELQ